MTKSSKENKVLGQINTVFPPLPHSENTVSLNQTDMQVMEQRVSVRFHFEFLHVYSTFSLCFFPLWTVTHVNPTEPNPATYFFSLTSFRVMRLLPSRVNPLFGYFFLWNTEYLANTWSKVWEKKLFFTGSVQIDMNYCLWWKKNAIIHRVEWLANLKIIYR
jgi:hypothetical protein